MFIMTPRRLLPTGTPGVSLVSLRTPMSLSNLYKGPQKYFLYSLYGTLGVSLFTARSKEFLHSLQDP